MNLARELYFAQTEMGGGEMATDDRSPTPPSGPPDLPPLPVVLTLAEQQEVSTPLLMHPTFPTHRTRATEPGVLELCSRFPRVCRLELCSPAYLIDSYLGTPELCSLSSEGLTAGAPLPRIPHPTRESRSPAPDSRRRIGRSSAPPLLLSQRCANPGSSWVAPQLVWPSSGGETA